MPTTKAREDEEEVTYWHEHELPRKRRAAYDDMAPTLEGGDNDE